jgi:O-antigen/teichoic acid export membrane protein
MLDSAEKPVPAGGALLARNSLLNLVGQAAPMLVAVAAIPPLLAALGTERFGVLALAWMAIGYFGVFDLGLSRALTQLVAEKLGGDGDADLTKLIWTALLLMVALGLGGALLLAVLTPWLVGGVLKIPALLGAESRSAFYLLAFSLPWVISTGGLRGVLEANQRFDLVNLVRLPLGIFTYLGPLLVLPFSRSLPAVVGILVAARLIAWLAHLLLCLRAIPAMRRSVRPQLSIARPLVRFGSWMTVSNLVSPLMVYLDRFVIGATISMSAVAFYVTPYELVTRLWLIPGALMGVLFPALSATWTRDTPRMGVLFDGGVRIVFLMILPVTLLLTTFAPEGLALWLGADFARESTAVLRWLAVGVYLNSIGQVAFAAVQGIGRPDVTGKLHLVELFPYLALLWWATARWGIEGAAVAWVGRVALDTVLLFALADRLVGEPVARVRRSLLLVAGGLALIAVSVLPETLMVKAVFAAVVLPLFGLAGWRHVLAFGERQLVRTALTTRVPAPSAS